MFAGVDGVSKSAVQALTAVLTEACKQTATQENTSGFDTFMAALLKGDKGDMQKTKATEENKADLEDLAMFEAALKTDKIKSKTQIDGRWRYNLTYKKPSEAERFKALNQVDQNREQKEWMQTEVSKLKIKTEKATSFSKEDSTRSDMLTFGGVVLLFGGWSWTPAIEGAKRACTKCVLLGGDYAEMDEFSELMHYRIFRKQYVETWKTRWTTFATKFNDQHRDATDVDNAPLTELARSSKDTRGSRKLGGSNDKLEQVVDESSLNPKAKAGALKRGRTTSLGNDRGRSPDASPNRDLKNVIKIKLVYKDTVADANALVLQIDKKKTQIVSTLGPTMRKTKGSSRTN